MFSFMMVALVVAAGKQNVWMRFWMRLFEGFIQNCELGRNIPNLQIRRPPTVIWPLHGVRLSPFVLGLFFPARRE
jgi:hypothetical protein